MGALVALGWPQIAGAQMSVHDFRLGGSAVLVSESCIRLTPDRPYTSGSAWFQRPVDLRRPFDIEVSLILGDKDESGADGIVFVLHPSLQTGRAGEGMGFSGMIPSVGIEFDTYQNFHLGDPAGDHVALMANGRPVHGADASRAIPLGNLEDGGRHPLRITWDPETRQLDVTLDGRSAGTHPAELIEEVFGEAPTLYWGFTAGTGRLSNAQDVCIDEMLLSSSVPAAPPRGAKVERSRVAPQSDRASSRARSTS